MRSVSLMLAVAALGASPAREPVRNDPGGVNHKLVAILDFRRESLLTIEAARGSAEADLRAALDQQPPDDARVRSLAAEIVAFGDAAVDVEEQAQEQLASVLGHIPGAHRVRF